MTNEGRKQDIRDALRALRVVSGVAVVVTALVFTLRWLGVS